MTIYNYNKAYLYFNKDVINTDFKELVKAGSVHFCQKFEYEELYVERHEKTRYCAMFMLDNNIKIELVEYNPQCIEKVLSELITPVAVLKEFYDSLKKNKRL